MKTKYVTVAGIWKNDNGYSIRLTNGELIGIWNNREKTAENKRPDLTITMSEDFAAKLRLEQYVSKEEVDDYDEGED